MIVIVVLAIVGVMGLSEPIGRLIIDDEAKVQRTTTTTTSELDTRSEEPRPSSLAAFGFLSALLLVAVALIGVPLLLAHRRKQKIGRTPPDPSPGQGERRTISG